MIAIDDSDDVDDNDDDDDYCYHNICCIHRYIVSMQSMIRLYIQSIPGVYTAVWTYTSSGPCPTQPSCSCPSSW